MKAERRCAMKYREVGFRAVYHRFCGVMLSENLKKVIDGFPGAEEANSVLTYGYYDKDAGLTLEILTLAIVADESFKFGKGSYEVSAKIRAGALEDEELLFCPDEDGKIAELFSEKLDILKSYDASEDVEKTREMEFLDPCRHELYIDDVLVRLVKEGLTPEECWVTITGLGDHYFVGTLLNEPDQDFGWHEGETIEFHVMKTDEDKIICFSDMDVFAKLSDEDLADGTIGKDLFEIIEK